MPYKICIITVTYNSADLLFNTIKSISNQTFKDYEYIIIDGASTDGTMDLVMQHKNSLWKWISEPDKGIYDAMNKGLKMATGEFVLFMNAGDTFYDEKTLSKIPFSKYPNADIFYGETLIVDDKGNVLGLRHKKLPHNLNWKHFNRGMVVCHQSILVRRTLAPEYNLIFKLSADVEWVLRCLKSSRQTIFTNTIVSRFLEGGASIVQHRESLKERFQIMRAYFGLPLTLLSHIGFILEMLIEKIGIKSYYRKNYLN